MLSDGFFDREKPLTIRWGDLPHWRQDGATYFVTYRLSDSLPEAKLDIIRADRDEWIRRNPSAPFGVLEEFSLDCRRRLEKWLDQGAGSCVLAHPRARKIVEDSLRYFDGERYELGEHAVAPNHVHAVVRTALGVDLSELLHSWKRFSSREIRKIIPARGPHLWQAESFDHIVRNTQSLNSISDYIRRHRE